MTRKQKLQAGFGVVEAMLLLIIIGALCFVAYNIGAQRKAQDASVQTDQSAEEDNPEDAADDTTSEDSSEDTTDTQDGTAEEPIE